MNKQKNVFPLIILIICIIVGFSGYKIISSAFSNKSSNNKSYSNNGEYSFKNGNWNKNVFTYDDIDLKITLPDKWGYSFLDSSQLEISSPNLEEKLLLQIIKGDFEQQLREGLESSKTILYDQTIEVITANIVGDEYKGFKEVFENDGMETKKYYRRLPNDGFILVIHADIKKGNNDIIGKLLEKNGNNTVEESVIDTIKSYKQRTAEEVFKSGISDENSYKNDFLGFKVNRPSGWDYFAVRTSDILLVEDYENKVVHNKVSIKIFDYDISNSEIEINSKEYELMNNGEAIKETETILGKECKTLTLKNGTVYKDKIKKYYYIPFNDGEYMLVVEADIYESSWSKFNLNDIISTY